MLRRLHTGSGSVTCASSILRIRLRPNSRLDPPSTHAKSQLQCRRFPLDEGRIVKSDGQSTEHRDDHEAHPQHGVNLAVTEPYPGNLPEGCEDRNRGGEQNGRLLSRSMPPPSRLVARASEGGVVRSGDLVGGEEKNDRKQIERNFIAGLYPTREGPHFQLSVRLRI